RFGRRDRDPGDGMLAAIPQARGQPVDGEVDPALGSLVGLSRAVASQQLDLQVIEWIEIRKTIADAARERWIVVQQALLSRDLPDALDRALVLACNDRKDRVASRRVRHEVRIPGC